MIYIANFPTDSKSASNSGFFYFEKNVHTVLALFTSYECKRGRHDSKNGNFSYKCVLELNFATINDLGEPSC